MDDKSLLDLVCRMSEDWDSFKEYLINCKKEITSVQMLGWDLANLRKINQDQQAANEQQKSINESLNKESVQILAKRKEELKTMEDASFKRNADARAENSILRSEKEKLLADIYQLQNSLSGQKVSEKKKQNV